MAEGAPLLREYVVKSRIEGSNPSVSSRYSPRHPIECEAGCTHHRPVRLSWAKLLKRVFDIDMGHCPNCGGELKIIAAILEQPVIEKILTHLGLQADCGRRSAPASGLAPQEGFALASANAACKAVHPPGCQPAARRYKPSPDTNSPVDCLCLARGRATGPTRPARGLTLPNRDCSGDPMHKAAGVGCVRGFAGPMEATW